MDANTGLIIPVGTTAQRPTGQTGMIRFNTTTTEVEVYNGGSWVSISPNNTITTNNFAGDNSTVAFTLGASTSTNAVIVTLNGTVQEATNAYSVSGTTLTFTAAPARGDVIQEVFIAEMHNQHKSFNSSLLVNEMHLVQAMVM